MGRLGDHSWKKGLGEPLLISPRRDQLAWASLSVSATIFTCNRCEDIPQATIPLYHTSISTGKHKKLTNHIKQQTRTKQIGGFQLPLPGNKLAKRPDTPSISNARAQQLKERTDELKIQRNRSMIWVTWNPSWEKNEMNNRDEFGLATVLTWSRNQLRTSLKTTGT